MLLSWILLLSIIPIFLSSLFYKFLPKERFSSSDRYFYFIQGNLIHRKEIVKIYKFTTFFTQKPTIMTDDIFRRLQKHLDNHPIPFPKTKSGSEINLLRSLFTEEEAKIGLHLSTLLERPLKIHKRIKDKKLTVKILEKMLYRMFKKGLIRGVKDRKIPGRFLYSKMPIAIGIFEAQVDQITQEVAENFYDYEKEGLADALIGNKTNQMRTIPLNVRIDPEFHVSNYDDISKILKGSPGPFAVMNCVCRQAKDTLGKTCSKSETRETCLLIEEGINFAMDLDVGRLISKEEALAIIKRAKKLGFVLQPENNQHPHFVCCCCGCCCGVLNAANLYDQPASYLHSNYFAQVDPERCTLCETCLERCPMDALNQAHNHMKVNLDRCIGCGACVPTCEDKAINLVKKDHHIIPPLNEKDMYKKIMVERFGLGGTLKFLAKAALGQKV